jgi:predicted GNAT family acetyltransferase
MSGLVPVWHNTEANRFEAVVNGHRSVCEYVLEGNKMIFTHTFVPPELRGRGIAEQLVRPALTAARVAGHKVVPACSYVAKFIERHREFADLLA